MTIASEYTTVTYIGDGVQSRWPFAYQVYSPDEVRAGLLGPTAISDLVYGADYTVTVNPSGLGGYVEYPAPAGSRLVLWLSTRAVQEVELHPSGHFDAKALEQGLDRLTLLAQQNAEGLERCVQVPPGGESGKAFADALFAAAQRAEAGAVGVEEAREALEAGLQRVVDEGQYQSVSVRATGNAMLADIHTAGSTALGALDSAATTQMQKMQATGTAERLALMSFGDTQAGALASVSASHAVEASAQADRAKTEADKAQAAAQTAAAVAGLGPATAASPGLVLIGEGIEVDSEGRISIGFPAVVSTPSVAMPEQMGIGYTYPVTMSAETAVQGAAIAYFSVAFDGAQAVRVDAQGGAATVQVTPEGAEGSVGALHVAAYDTLGHFSRKYSGTFIKSSIGIAVPRILAPLDGDEQVSITPALAIQAFSIGGMTDSPANTHIQIARDVDFSDLLADTGEAYPYTTRYDVPALPVNSRIYARARHKGALYGWSGWSSPVAFITLRAETLAPVVVFPAEGASGVALQPEIRVSAFANSGPTDTAKGTQIQVALDSSFTQIIHQHSGAYADSFTPATSLDLLTAYYVRVRHEGTLWGWSPWSATRLFVTKGASISQPAIISPAPGANGVAFNPIVTISAPAADSQEWTGTQCRVKQGATLIYDSGETGAVNSFATSGISGILASYTVEVRVKGSINGWGAWVTSTFTTQDVSLAPLSIISPTPGASGISYNPAVTIAEPVAVNQTVSMVQCRVKQGATTVYDSGQCALQTVFATSGITGVNTLYTVEVAAKGSLTGWGPWAASSFTTLSGQVLAPAITAPLEGFATAQPFTLILSDFTSTGITDTHLQTIIQYAATPDFAAPQTITLGAVKSHIITPAVIGLGAWYFRARYVGKTLGTGLWSQTLKVTSMELLEWHFETSGTFTAPHTANYKVTVVGGGGSGGAYGTQYGGAGGGGGSFIVEKTVSLTAGQQVAAIVGGSNTDSSFGDLVSKAGGKGSATNGNWQLVPGNAVTANGVTYRTGAAANDMGGDGLEGGCGAYVHGAGYSLAWSGANGNNGFSSAAYPTAGSGGSGSNDLCPSGAGGGTLGGASVSVSGSLGKGGRGYGAGGGGGKPYGSDSSGWGAGGGGGGGYIIAGKTPAATTNGQGNPGCVYITGL